MCVNLRTKKVEFNSELPFKYCLKKKENFFSIDLKEINQLCPCKNGLDIGVSFKMMNKSHNSHNLRYDVSQFYSIMSRKVEYLNRGAIIERYSDAEPLFKRVEFKDNEDIARVVFINFKTLENIGYATIVCEKNTEHENILDMSIKLESMTSESNIKLVPISKSFSKIESNQTIEISRSKQEKFSRAY